MPRFLKKGSEIDKIIRLSEGKDTKLLTSLLNVKNFKPLIKQIEAYLRNKKSEHENLTKQFEKASKTIDDLKREREQFRESISEMLSIQKLSEIISASHNINEVLSSLIKLSNTLVNIKGCGVFLFKEKKSKLFPILLDNISENAKQKIFSQIEDGIIDWVIKERRPTVVPDIQSETNTPDENQEANFIIIPLIVRNKCIGVFEIYSDVSQSSITFQDLELLSLLANQAAVAIENSRLYKEMNNKINELSLLFEISNQIDSVPNINAFLNKTSQKVCEQLRIPLCLFFLKKTDNCFILKGSHGIKNTELAETIPENVPAFHDSIKTQKIRLSIKPPFLKHQNIFNTLCIDLILCIPLSLKKEIIGVMVIGAPITERYSLEYAENLLTTIANQTSIWIERSHLFVQLKETNRSLMEMQDQLIQSSKLAALGQLAGGIAHEINNPLQTILVKTQIIMKKLAQENIKLDELLIIESETRRIAGIVKALLDFARQRQNTEIFEDILISEIIHECVSLLRYQMEIQNIRVHLHLSENIPLVRGNLNQLKQVFLNLLINAKQAMPNGGDLTITAKAEGKSVVLQVMDTGKGIQKKYLDKIFEPFFTTKPEGSGTGLGLSISYGIVEKHGGKIIVESKEGKGAIFTVTLPLSHLFVRKLQA